KTLANAPPVLFELRNRAVALLTVLLECFDHDGVIIAGQKRLPFAGRLRLHLRTLCPVLAERQLQGERLIDGHAEAEKIGAKVNFLRAACLFRAAVGGRTNALAEHRAEALLGQPRQPKIATPDAARVPDEPVGRLE